MSTQALGVAVIERALEDAAGRPFAGKKSVRAKSGGTVEVLVPNTITESAVEFLTRQSNDLAFWCEVAGVSVEAVVKHAQRKFRGKLAAIADARAFRLAKAA
jgi:hypothetical protein